MRIIATPIPEKSHGIRVWRNEPPGDDLPETRSPYQFACNLIHMDSDTCELAQAIGEFDASVAILVGIKAIELGYKKMVFYRPAGRAAVRMATYVRSEDGFDYYEVDLIKTLNEINKNGGV